MKKHIIILGCILITYFISNKVGLSLLIPASQTGFKQTALSLTVDASHHRISSDTIHPKGKIINTRFIVPKGFQRLNYTDNSFANYLRKLPLKPIGSPVKLYDGSDKPNHDTYEAVVDLPIGKKNLHQCADAIMRLQAEYLWKQNRYDEIHFNFTNGFRAPYTKWMQGNRVVVNGNKCYWKKKVKPSNTYKTFWSYLETIFMYAGTLSLSKELIAVSIANLQIGDIFIQGGSPGHAIIVVDIAVNPINKQKAFLLAQSYMPAQEIQVLKNPNHSTAWYFTPSLNGSLVSPEWTFEVSDLKRFPPK